MARQKKENPVLVKLRRQAQSFDSIVTEVKRQYREINVGNVPEDLTLRIRWPDLEAEENINRAYAKEYGKFLSDPDMKTEEELRAIMAARGVWTDEDERLITALRERVAMLSRQLMENEDKMTEKERDEICEKYANSSKDLERLTSKRHSLITENSIEGRVNEIKIKIQLSECVFAVDKDGNETRLWSSLDDINNEQRRLLLNRVINEAIGFWNGVPSNFLGDLPDLPSGEKDTPSPKKRVTRSSQSPSANGGAQD